MPPCGPPYSRTDPCLSLPLQGPPLFDLLDDIESAARDACAPFRMPIMDRYRREERVGVADGHG